MQAPWQRRSILLAAAAAAMLSAACRSRPSPDARDPSAPLRRELAAAEARRGAAVGELVAMVPGGDPLRTSLALRALGRVGGAEARARLLASAQCATTASRDSAAGAAGAANAAATCPAEALAAAAALGVNAALDELLAAELGATSEVLVAGLGRATTAAEQAIWLEALGRAGTEPAQPAMLAYLSRGGVAAEAAAIALGRHGRRSLRWSPETRAAVLQATTHHDSPLRYAATWALGREASPPTAADPSSETVAAALALRLSDDDGETRAAAASALARRKLGGLAAAAVFHALEDADWRVAIEAMRALATIDEADAPDRLAAAVAARMKSLAAAAGGAPGDSQVVVEGLRQLAAHGARPAVAAALRAALISSEAVRVRAKVAAGWIRCLATAALERAAAAPDPGKLLGCGGAELPEAYAASVVAELVSAGVGAPPARRAAVDRMWAAADPRVRAAALRALPPSLVGVAPADAAALLARLAEALGKPNRAAAAPPAAAADPKAQLDAMLVSTAVESLGELWPDSGLPAELDPAVRASLEAIAQAVIARAATERDPEIAAALLDFIAARKLRSGEPSCRAAAASASPVIARAATRCLVALGDAPAPAPGTPPAAEPPPVDLALGAGSSARWRWRLTTDHGVVEIDLDSAAAPWHVAGIVTLTQRHFYDGLELHRVVPNFVVQGGDPTQSGSGGPGFSLPAEPGSRLDGESYRAGAVGFADAGKDSGGSQWFVMHSRSPHLEGRYTRVGQLVSGQQVIDRLLVGDRVVTAQVVALPR